jgi:hypothetical protein
VLHGGNASDDSGSWNEVDQDSSRHDDNASDYCESDVGRTDNINRSDVAVMMEEVLVGKVAMLVAV